MDTTLILVIATIALLVICLTIANTAGNSFLRKYHKYSEMILNTTYTAGDLIIRLVNDSGYKKLKLAYTEKELDDAFSSKDNTIILSKKTINSYSIAGYATAVHEFGHAVQYNSGQIGYRFFKIFKIISYVFGKLAFPLMLIGLLLKLIVPDNEWGYILLIGGASIFAISLLTELFTIPIEYGASNIGLAKLKEYDVLGNKEYRMAKRFLRSAGLTYVAAFLSTILAWTFLVPKQRRK